MMRSLLAWWRRWQTRRVERQHHDRVLALMIVEIWQLGAPLPKPALMRWCNKQLRREMFPMREGGKG